MLTPANFEESIDSVILQCGRSYHANGRVIRLLEVDTRSWRAIVEGAYMYQVEISIAPDEALEWICHRPHPGRCPAVKDRASPALEGNPKMKRRARVA